MVTAYLWLHRSTPLLHLFAAAGSRIVSNVTIGVGQSNLAVALQGRRVVCGSSEEGTARRRFTRTPLSVSEGG